MCLTRKVSTAGEEGLDVIFMEAIVLQHSVELLKILNVTLERHLLLPATCRVHTYIMRGTHEHSTDPISNSLDITEAINPNSMHQNIHSLY